MVSRQIRAAADDAGADHEAAASGVDAAATPRAVGDDAGVDVGLGHVDRHVERAGKAQRVGAAMAFHHHAVQAQKNAAIGGARIELAAQRVQRAATRSSAPSLPTAASASARWRRIVRHQLGGAFGGLERDIAGEAVGHHHIHRAFGDVVAFDKAVKCHRQVGRCAGSGRRP